MFICDISRISPEEPIFGDQKKEFSRLWNKKHYSLLSRFERNCPKATKMVKIALQIKANLECIEKLYTNHPYYQWFLKLQCSSCGEGSEKFHDLTEAEKVPHKHNRSETNLLIKCKLCGRENSLDVIEGSNGEYTSNDAGKFKTIVLFDCRGVEPVDFQPQSGWIAEAENEGKKFEDVDLSEKEWVDYDEKNKTSVGVYDLEWQFIKVK